MSFARRTLIDLGLIPVLLFDPQFIALFRWSCKRNFLSCLLIYSNPNSLWLKLIFSQFSLVNRLIFAGHSGQVPVSSSTVVVVDACPPLKAHWQVAKHPGGP